MIRRQTVQIRRSKKKEKEGDKHTLACEQLPSVSSLSPWAQVEREEASETRELRLLQRGSVRMARKRAGIRAGPATEKFDIKSQK